jgi:hypothetical protein
LPIPNRQSIPAIHYLLLLVTDYVFSLMFRSANGVIMGPLNRWPRYPDERERK